ncbi:tRNA threonylcarbamoyl adenosine modification protein (Sua5/YciO/YrdC/YwlC family) [Paeniglutamicibacter psychrophenolicus]|uniref:L-threonylcarbamoyladenylate synthase n=1 Tax=Paeniglutamicibacter psychrophenolicus TaxID=257454 RepID=A0ABS4WDN6_9MICC|nr:tRNA threonylcarbamoyl adenosine modification protein (Sua5/YciO/YrdC/YwlC family) [Paeniglutamicibacter psychrophenolicus]
MTSRFDARDSQELETGLEAARAALAENRCIVMPTDTVYGIAADAFSAQAVATLLAAKGRGRSMPPPVLIPQAATLDGLAADVPDFARELAARFWPGALTLILHAQPSLTWDLGETRGTVALRVPDDQIARDLLKLTGPLAVSSANRTGQPAADTAEAAFDQLGETVEVYLEAGPRPVSGDALGSTIIDCTLTPPRVVRAGALSLELLRVVVPELLDADGQPDPAIAAADAPEAGTAEAPNAAESADGDADASTATDASTHQAAAESSGVSEETAGSEAPDGHDAGRADAAPAVDPDVPDDHPAPRDATAKPAPHQGEGAAGESARAS